MWGPMSYFLLSRWCCQCCAATCLTGGSTDQRATQTKLTAAARLWRPNTWTRCWETSSRSSTTILALMREPGWKDWRVIKKTVNLNLIFSFCSCWCLPVIVQQQRNQQSTLHQDLSNMTTVSISCMTQSSSFKTRHLLLCYTWCSYSNHIIMSLA